MNVIFITDIIKRSTFTERQKGQSSNKLNSDTHASIIKLRFGRISHFFLISSASFGKHEGCKNEKSFTYIKL